MDNAFEVLGIAPTQNKQAVRDAYHRRVKQCHPDRFMEPERQAEAQKQMIALNLAYEEAMRFTQRHASAFHSISCEQAKEFALRLLKQHEPEAALRQLTRADMRDDGWYHIEGLIMMELLQFAAAHRSFREAVRREPDNSTYRQAALDAAVELKKRKHLVWRVKDKVLALLGRKKVRP